ncbi:hypothetical protein D9M71_543010 [compost metagenome]
MDALKARQAAEVASAEQETRLRQNMQQPDFLNALDPLARQFAMAGASPEQIARAQSVGQLGAYRDASLEQRQGQFDARQAHAGTAPRSGASGPRMPAPRAFVDQPQANNMMQRFRYNPQIQDYEPFGEPFPQYSPGRGKAATGAGRSPIDDIVDSLAPDPTGAGAGADLGQLPGGAPLSSYAPKPSAPTPLLSAGGGGQVKRAAPATQANSVARPQSAADFAKLPKGALFIDPDDGKTYRKP